MFNLRPQELWLFSRHCLMCWTEPTRWRGGHKGCILCTRESEHRNPVVAVKVSSHSSFWRAHTWKILIFQGWQKTPRCLDPSLFPGKYPPKGGGAWNMGIPGTQASLLCEARRRVALHISPTRLPGWRAEFPQTQKLRRPVLRGKTQELVTALCALPPWILTDILGPVPLWDSRSSSSRCSFHFLTILIIPWPYLQAHKW